MIPCELCRSLAARTLTTTRDCDVLIRDMVDYSGCDAARSLESEAANARKAYAFDAGHPRACCRSRAPVSLRAARRYALAAWAMRRLQAGRDAAAAAAEAHREAFAGLPFEDLA